MADDNYKREEDRKWRESVETRLVSLTSAQKTTDNDLDKLSGRIDDMDQLLEGDPLKREDSGLKGDVHELGRGLNALRSIMAPDALGHGGVKNRLDNVEGALGLRVSRSANRVAVTLAVIAATATITAAIVMSLDKIEPFFKQLTGLKTAISQSTKPHRAKTARKPRRPAAVQAAPEEPDDSTAAPLP